MPARLSLSALARTLGVRLSAVQRAIADGRLTKASVGRDRKRRPFIRDPEAARVEWEARTRPRITEKHGLPPIGGSAATPSGLARETERERKARADVMEFDLQRKRG